MPSTHQNENICPIFKASAILNLLINAFKRASADYTKWRTFRF